MTTHREWSFGTHRAYLEREDLLVVRYEGPTRMEDATEVVKIFQEACATEQRFLLVDIGRSSIEARVRKYLAEEINPQWFSGVVYVGANLAARMMAKALSILVLFNAKIPYQMAFATDDAEAYAILEGWQKKKAQAVRFSP